MTSAFASPCGSGPNTSATGPASAARSNFGNCSSGVPTAIRRNGPSVTPDVPSTNTQSATASPRSGTTRAASRTPTACVASCRASWASGDATGSTRTNSDSPKFRMARAAEPMFPA